MSKVPTPATAPNQADALAVFAESLPEPWRDVIARYAKYVNVECAAMQVGAVERAAAAHAHQLALLGVIAASAQSADHQGDSDFSSCIEDCHRGLRRLRLKCLQQIGCRITQERHGTSEIETIEGPQVAPWDDSDIAQA